MIPLVERAVVGAILERRRAAIAAAWYRAIAPTGFAARPAAEVRRTLDALTQQVLTLLVSERVAPAQAEAIGAALVNLHFVQPATLAQTLGVLTHAVVDGLALEQAAVVRPNLDALLCGVAAGFFDRARTLILTEQEEARIALLEARQAAEAALHVSEERLRTVVSNAPIVLFALDQAGVFTLCMGQALAELGLTAPDVVGRSMLDVYRDAPASVEHVRRALQGARFCATTEVAGRVFETWYAPLSDPHREGDVLGVIGVATDITARKRADEERLAFEQLRDDFVANISHELRTPLHHITGYTALLQRGPALDEPTRQDFLTTIASASDQLARLINDLLEVAQSRRSELRLAVEEVRLDQLVVQVVQRWQGISSHRITVRGVGPVPPVLADAGRLEQVLDNLLVNVVRHTPAQTAAEVQVVPGEGEVVVTVVDHGPGVAPEELPRLFERFYQGAVPAGGHRQGSGLGLYICKRIVEQHDGRIWAEGTAGGGLTIRFAVPWQDAALLGRDAQQGERAVAPAPGAEETSR